MITYTTRKLGDTIGYLYSDPEIWKKNNAVTLWQSLCKICGMVEYEYLLQLNSYLECKNKTDEITIYRIIMYL